MFAQNNVLYCKCRPMCRPEREYLAFLTKQYLAMCHVLFRWGQNIDSRFRTTRCQSPAGMAQKHQYSVLLGLLGF